MPISSFVFYLTAHCFSVCFVGFSFSAGLSVLMSLRALFMVLRSYCLLSLNNLNYPRAIGARSVSQAPDECIQLPSAWILLGYPTHRSVKLKIIKIICIGFLLPSNLLLPLCLGKWHHPSSCYPESNLKVDLDFVLFPLPAYLVNHKFWSTPLVLFYSSTDIILAQATSASLHSQCRCTLAVFSAFRLVSIHTPFCSLLDNVTLKLYLI